MSSHDDAAATGRAMPGRILLIAGALWSALGGLAQAAAPVAAVRPMYFEHLTMRDGLSHSTVEGMLQDSRGYLWLATESGLDRYDGYSVRVYHRERGNPTKPEYCSCGNAEKIEQRVDEKQPADSPGEGYNQE